MFQGKQPGTLPSQHGLVELSLTSFSPITTVNREIITYPFGHTLISLSAYLPLFCLSIAFLHLSQLKDLA